MQDFPSISLEVTQKPITELRNKLHEFAIWLMHCSDSLWLSGNFLWLTAEVEPVFCSMGVSGFSQVVKNAKRDIISMWRNWKKKVDR